MIKVVISYDKPLNNLHLICKNPLFFLSLYLFEKKKGREIKIMNDPKDLKQRGFNQIQIYELEGLVHYLIFLSYLSIYVSVCLPIYLSICLSIYQFVYLSYLSI